MSVTDKKPWEKYSPEIAESDDLKPWEKYVPSEEKKSEVQNDLTSGTQTSKRGFEPFQTPVDTKTPSVLTPKGKTEYQEQVKDYVPPKAVQQQKEEEPDFFESVKNSLSNVGTGVQQFIPNTAIALSETLQGLLGKDLGSDFYRNIVGSANNPELDRQEAYAKLAELEPQFKRTRGLIESAENFDAVGLAAATVDAMSSLVRTAITSVPTAGIGLASDMVGGSIASYNKEKAKSKGISVDELYKRGENEFAIPATIGAIGTGLEAIGLKGTIGLINKKLTGSFAKKFATTFVDVNKEGLTEFLQTGLDASNKALSQGKSVADASKVAVDEMFSKKGLESYLMGVVGSAGSAGVGRVVKGMLPTNKKKATEATQRIAEMESELSNPNISPATQEFIAENIRQNVAEVADAIENDANEVEGLSDDQKFTINSINEVIGSYEQVLADPNASEQTKKLAQERINGLDLEVDNILEGKKLSPETQALVESKVPSLEKPTIDTEEQIIEEGQQAEADFQATDDLVTYEQKMKELDDRANQLIPEPTTETPKAEGKEVGGYVRKKEMKSENDKLQKRKFELATDRDDVVTGEGKYKNFGKKERDARLEEIRSEVKDIDNKQESLQRELKVIEAKENGSVELFDNYANNGSTNSILYDIKANKLYERENITRGKTKEISIEDAAKQKFEKTQRGRNQREINEAYTENIKAKYESEIIDEINKYKKQSPTQEAPKAEGSGVGGDVKDTFENRESIEKNLKDLGDNVYYHGSDDISYLNSKDDITTETNTKNAKSKYVNITPKAGTAISYSIRQQKIGKKSGVAAFSLNGKGYEMKDADIKTLKTNEDYEAFYDKKKLEGYDFVKVPQDANNVVVLNNDAIEYLGKKLNREAVSKSPTQEAEVTVSEIEKPKSIRLNMSEEGLAKMEGKEQKDVYPTRQFFENKPNNVGLPEPDSPQFDPFMSENKDNTKEETVDLSEITPTQELVDKSGIGGKLTVGNPKLVRFNDGLFVLDGHHRISTEAVKGNTKIKADVTTIDMTSDEWSEQKINKFLNEQENAVNQGNIEQSNITERERITEQQQGQQEDRQYQEEPISQAETTPSNRNIVSESREVEEIKAKETEVAKLEKEYEKLSKALSVNLKENQQGMFENKPQSMFDDKSDQSKIVKAKKAELDKAKSELKDLKDKAEREADKVNQQEIEFTNEEDYTLNQVEKTNDPEELASLYYQQESAEPDYKTEGIMDYLGTRTRINLRDWKRYNDENNLTPAIRRRYIDSTNKSGDLDANAMELSEQLGIEITPDDFANVILDFGSTKEYKAQSKTKVQKAISDKYYELTGKKLTEGRAERAYFKIQNKPKTDKELYELNESLQEIGITYEDIQNYNEYAKQESDGTQESVQATKDDAGTSRQLRGESKGVQKEEVNEFTEEEDLKIKQIAIDANNNIGNYIKNVPSGKKDKFANNIYKYEATNPFTNEKVVFNKKSDASDYVISEIAKANTKSGRESIFNKPNEKAKTEEVKRPIETPRVAERKGESAKLQTAKEKLAEAKAKLDALNKNLGIASDPEQKAKALFEYHKALVNYAIEYIKDVANDIAKFAKEVGLDVSEVKDAWIEANGGEKKTVKDFIPTTTLRNADVEQKRADYGFDEPTVRPKISNEETLNKAIKAIQENPNVPYDVIDKALNGESLDAVEMAILAQFQGIKEAELIDSNNKIEEAKDSSVLAFDNAVDKRNKIIDDLVMAYDASEISGTVAGRALQARKIKVLQDYSIANMLIRVRKANNNRPLTNEQVADITDKYNKLVEAETKYQERITKLEEENAKLKSQQSFNRIRTESAREAREAKRTRTKETLAKERESIFEQMRKLAKKGRGELSANPIPAEMIPLIGKLAKNYFIDGITSIEAIVDKIYGDVKDIVEGVEKRDVRDAISGYSRDTRPTKDDLQADIRDLKQQAELISRIEDAEKGILSKNERVKTEASEEVKKLRARLKDLTKEEVALEQLKTRIKRQIAETTKKINNKDYSKKEPNVVELDEEAKKLRDAYRKIKFEFDVAVAKDQLESRTKGEKLKDLFIEIANIPRALMATADLSAPLRQGILPTISNPIMASRAFSEMLKQWSSQERADTWLADLKDSPAYQLMQDSDLYIADRNNPQLAAKEEDFQTNLAEKIPIIGKGFKIGNTQLGEVKIGGKKIGNLELIGRSERAYVSYLNKMRVDLFTKGVDVLQNQGITFAQNPQAYKALASYINASTGRGGLGALERAAPVFNTTFFSPRLIASRLQLLSGYFLWGKGMPPAVRKMYLADMAKFISFGLGILVLASLAGADVEDDPRSPDFGKIRHGNTRWDIWGGMQQVVRYMAQLATGQKKSSASGRIVELDGTNYNKETRLSVIGNFVRSKLAPIPAFMYNALAGENMVGERFKLEKDVPQMLLPLVAQGIYDSYKQDGLAFAIGATGIPSILGIGVQTYGVNDFLQQGVDNKAINLLLSKKAVAIEPKEGDKTIYDINTGEERQMTSSEFKKYYSKWTEYIKDNLNSNYDVFSKMTNEQFEKEFRSMKTRASKLAKEEVSGVSSEVLRIEENDVTYQLTPKQVKERLQLNKEYEAEFGSDIVEAQIEVAKENGKSLSEAQIIADKKLKSSANRYSKYQMLEKYTDANGNIKLNIK